MNRKKSKEAFGGLALDFKLPNDEPAINPSFLKDIFGIRALKIQLGTFAELNIFLKRLFIGQMLESEDVILSDEQILVLRAIINKNFEVILPVKNIYPLNGVIDEKTAQGKKRPEKCYKFVFKHAFKNLKRIRSNNKSNEHMTSRCGTNTLGFCEYYFSETSKSIGVPLRMFFLPLTPDSCCNKRDESALKTINMSYMRLISNSDAFMRDLIYYPTKNLLSTVRCLSVPRSIHDQQMG